MRRRDIITMLGGVAAAWARIARAQSVAKRKPLIGFLSAQPRLAAAVVVSAFLDGMRDAGYEDGRNVDIAYRFADGRFERLPALAQELVALKPDVVLASSATPAALAARQATQTIPIVCPTLVDEVANGLVESDARPGGNVTGLSLYVEGMNGKLVELITDMVAHASRIALLNNSAETTVGEFQHDAQSAASARSVQLVSVDARTPDDLEGAFDRIGKMDVQAVLLIGGSMFFGQRNRIAALASQARLPSIYPYREFVVAGGLASYGVSTRDNHRRSAVYVDKILKGTNPIDLPIEFPTKLELVINLKTAKALGLTIPPMLLARADEVIE
jgi:putative ABC transport system substrate-binding protein